MVDLDPLLDDLVGERVSPFDARTELGRDLAAVDWATTGVGSWQQWPAALSSTVRLMTASRFAMWMAWGPDLTFFCNEAYRQDTLGDKYPWALGRPASEVWSEIWAEVLPLVDSVLSDGVATWSEGLFLLLERNGYPEETHHTFSYSPLADDDGTISGLFCVVREDTARIVSERRLEVVRGLGDALATAASTAEVCQAAAAQLGAATADVPFALGYLFDADGTADLAWTAGRTDDGSTAWTDRDLWHDALFDPPADGVVELTGPSNQPRGAWQVPATRALTVPLRRLGERAPYGRLIVGLNPHRPLDAGYRDFAGLMADQLSAGLARARAFEQERERADQLSALDRAKTTFFTNVSHELRTPLTLLLGPVDDALADRADPLAGRQHGRAVVIRRNAERLLKLVNTLLDFSRLESGRAEAQFRPVDLARLTAELASMFESAYARAGLELAIECPSLSDPVHVDTEMWSKIVFNLLSNALKATFTGGATVRLDTDADVSGVLLEVTDTGVGIPPDEVGRLFERFHRVQGSRLRTHEGSGIGLALVAELVELHGGTVAVHSELGVGTTMSVRIPLGAAHLPTDRILGVDEGTITPLAVLGAGYLAETTRWLAATAEQPGEKSVAPRADGPRVLVVDDNPDMREYVQGLLGELYAVRCAADGVEALDLIHTEAPDLVVTDVMMPELDGFGLLSSMRADPGTAHIPVIMLSARSGDDAVVEGLEAGADDYLVKPFSARELLARVHANLELDRVRRLAEQLERNRELLARAEELAHLGSWEVEPETGRTWLSAELRRILGVADDTFEAGSVPAALARAVDKAVEQSSAGRAQVDIEASGVRPDGTPYLLLLRAAVVPNGPGGSLCVRGSAQEITEQRAAQVEVAAAHAEREVAAREHRIATELQRSLLPAPTFATDRLEIASFYRAGVEGTQVGGDWQDVVNLSGGRTALVIGDVMGRGVRAAAVMGQLRAAVRAYARLDLEPDELIRLLDDTVREVSADTIVTAVYAVHDPVAQTLHYANAGHLPPLLTAPDGRTVRLEAGGPPLGAGYHTDVGDRVPIEPGSTLTLYTDGLVERRSLDLDPGIDELARLVSAADVELADLPALLVDAMLPDGPDDDVALLVCRVTERDGGVQQLVHDVVGGAAALAQSRVFVRHALARWQVDDQVGFDIELAVSELITNALRYGERPVQLGIVRSSTSIEVQVHDGGRGTPIIKHASPDATGGRGMLIVDAVSREWGVRERSDGKTVWCRFPHLALPDAAPGTTSR